MLILPGVLANQRKLGKLLSQSDEPAPVFAPYSGRYFRLQFDSGASGIRLAEIEVYSTAIGTDVTTPSSTIVASSSRGAGDQPSEAISNTSTPGNSGSDAWRPSDADDAPWIEVDLGSVMDIIGFYAVFHHGNYYDPFTIQISDDQVTYTDILYSGDYSFELFVNRSFYQDISSPRHLTPTRYRLTINHDGESERLIAGVDLEKSGVSLLPDGRWHGYANQTINRDYDRFDVVFYPTPGDYWRSTTDPGILTLITGTDDVADALILTAPSTVESRAPSDFTLERTEDGGDSWTTVLSVTGETGWAANEERSYTIS